jgi:hypothetical protein
MHAAGLMREALHAPIHVGMRCLPVALSAADTSPSPFRVDACVEAIEASARLWRVSFEPPEAVLFHGAYLAEGRMDLNG